MSWFYEHGWAMALTFAGLGWLQMAFLRYFRGWRWSMLGHRVCGTLIFLLTLYYGGYALYRIGKVYDDCHGPLGILITVIITFVLASGVVAHKSIESSQDNNWIQSVRNLHKKIAYFTLITGILCAFFGIFAYHRNRKVLSALHWNFISGVSFFISVAEILFRNYQKTLQLQKVDHSISAAEFRFLLKETTQCYLIVNDLVVDVTDFDHPGGKYIFAKRRGQDVTKYVFGGYSHKSGMKQHTHSQTAIQVINSLTVFTLHQPVSPVQIDLSINGQNKKLDEIQTFVFAETGPLQHYFKNMLVSLNGDHHFGKHFSVQNGQTRRQYSIAQCLTPSVYTLYVKKLQ